MKITKEMLIEEFKRQIDFAKFVESEHTSPLRLEFLEFAIQYMLDLEDENKRLRESYRIAVQDNADTCQLLFKAEDELKRMKTERDYWRATTKISGAVARPILVCQMVQRLKQERERQDGLEFDLVSFETIDRIAQEMIGEMK